MLARLTSWSFVGWAITATLSGCVASTHEARWGAGTTIRPGWRSFGDAAVASATDERVWIPLVGALAFQLGTADRDVSDWAHRRTPLTGSTEEAEELSDHLLMASRASYLIAAATSTSGVDPASWLSDKMKGAVLGAAALGLAGGVTSGVKHATGRLRPDRSDRLSLPSGHASHSSANATLASRTLPFVRMGAGARTAYDATVLGLALSCAWFRIEAGRHYPSDVLAGMALGRFVAGFVGAPSR